MRTGSTLALRALYFMVVGLLWTPLTQLNAQSPFIPADPNGEVSAKSWTYLPNPGQCFDLAGNFRPDVKFMSVGTFPTVFALKKNRIAITVPELDLQIPSNSRVHRVDMTFVGTSALEPTPQLLEPRAHRYNFYEARCPQGVVDVTGGGRLIYENAYEKIDVHLSSNSWGPKMYVVVRPGGDPSKIKIAFTGLDSMALDVEGFLKLYFDTQHIKLDQAFAYQQQGNSVVLLPWTATYELAGDDVHVGLDIQNYDATLPLIFILRPQTPDAALLGGGGGPPPPEWCTYLGGGGNDAVSDLTHDDEGGLYYTGRSSSTSGLPVDPGISIQPQLGGQTDMILGRVNQFYEMQTDDASTWTTYFGGAQAEEGNALVFDGVNNRLAVVGLMGSSHSAFPNIQFPGNPGSYSRTFSLGFDNFVSFWDPVSGRPTYMSRFPGVNLGASSSTNRADVDVDINGNTYLTGSGSIQFQNEMITPPVGSYTDYQSSDYEFITGDGYVMQLDPQANLVWNTIIGGPHWDGLQACVVDDENDLLYVVGYTESGSSPDSYGCTPSVTDEAFPLCSDGATEYGQRGLNANFSTGENVNSDGVVAAIKLSSRDLVWSTYFGGVGQESIQDAALASNGDLYVVGTATSLAYSPQTCQTPDGTGGFPVCDAGGYFNEAVGGRKHFIAKFNALHSLKWSTRLGDAQSLSLDESQIRLTVDENDQVIVFGSTVWANSNYTEPMAPWILPDAYYRGAHNDEDLGPTRADCYLAGFNPNTEPVYGTFFGGIGDDLAYAVEAFDDRIYIGGEVYAGLGFPVNAPEIAGHDPYLDDLPNVQLEVPDAFLAQLRYNVTIGSDEVQPSTSAQLVVQPNPTNGSVQFLVPMGYKPTMISLFDASGRLLLERNGPAAQTFILDLSSYRDGVYHARVMANDRAYSVKITKVN